MARARENVARVFLARVMPWRCDPKALIGLAFIHCADVRNERDRAGRKIWCERPTKSADISPVAQQAADVIAHLASRDLSSAIGNRVPTISCNRSSDLFNFLLRNR
jgi:hypothetical protein